MTPKNPEFRISDAVVPDSLEFEDFAQAHLQRVNPSEYGNIEFAFKISAEAHSGQFRNSGESYFSHPLMVARYYLEAGGRRTSLIIAALLHDIREDSFKYLAEKGERLTRDSNPSLTKSWNMEDYELEGEGLIVRQFGMQTAEIIGALTRNPLENNSSRTKRMADRKYLEQVSQGPPEAWLLKGFDILHNNRTLPLNDLARIARKRNETKQGFLPLIQKAAQRFPIVGGVLLRQMIVDLNILETRIKQPAQSTEPITQVTASA